MWHMGRRDVNELGHGVTEVVGDIPWSFFSPGLAVDIHGGLAHFLPASSRALRA